MKHYFTKRVRLVLLIAVLLAVILALTGLKLPHKAVQGLLSPLRMGVSRLADGAEQLYDYIFKYESLLAENEALKSQIAEMEDATRDAYAAQKENERLRALLELKAAREDFKLVDAYIF